MNARRAPVPPLLTVERRSSSSSDTAALLLPGLGADHQVWKLFVALLPESLDVIYGPPVSQGATAAPALRSIPDLAAAVSAQLRNLQHKRYIVVSHSLGAFPALELSALGMPGIAKLILVNGGLEYSAELLDRPIVTAVQLPRVALTTALLFGLTCAPTTKPFRRTVAESWRLSQLFMGPFVSDRALADIEVRRILIRNAQHPELLFGLWRNRHYLRRLRGIRQRIHDPITVLVGTNDPLATQQSSAAFVSMLPNATSVTVSGAKHCIPLECPEAIVRELPL